MSELIHQLGIDWRLFLAQAINFVLVFLVLKKFIYKPALRILEERRKKIEDGLLKSKEAEQRLLEIEKIKLQKIKEAEKLAIEFIEEKQKKAKQLENQLILEAKEKQKILLEETYKMIEEYRQKSKEGLYFEAKNLIKEILIRVVELDPQKIDEALINQALQKIKI